MDLKGLAARFKGKPRSGANADAPSTAPGPKQKSRVELWLQGEVISTEPLRWEMETRAKYGTELPQARRDALLNKSERL